MSPTDNCSNICRFPILIGLFPILFLLLSQLLVRVWVTQIFSVGQKRKLQPEAVYFKQVAIEKISTHHHCIRDDNCDHFVKESFDPKGCSDSRSLQSIFQ